MAQVRSREALVGVLVALLALAAAIGVAPRPAYAADQPLTVATSRPVTGETTVLRGRTAPATRPVGLQVLRDGAWRGVYSKRTGSRGSYAFSVRATAAAERYRVVAPRARVGRVTVSARTSRTVTVQGRAGSATLDVVGAPVGQRSDGASGMHPARAVFSPARPGRAAHLYRLVNGRWTWVVSGTQGSTGAATFQVPAAALSGAPSTTMRAVSVLAGGAQVVSREVAVTPQRRTFTEEFSGSALSSTRWGTRYQPYHGNRMCARPAAGLTVLSGGVATLKVRKVRGATRACPHGTWANPMITTAGGSSPFLQARGTFAARIKWNAAVGMHGGFWLQGPGGTGAEIDINEYFGARHPAGLTTKIHYTDTSTSPYRVSSVTSGNLAGRLGAGRTPSGSWNVYSVEWTPERYVFRINGVVTMVTAKPHVSTAEQEVILSVLTSDWELRNLSQPSRTMQVDWVRAWQR